mmetsp:Transcript_60622/g.158836  ORF Transcript_60622/g.158836 Transcript_60622/m.158836 type:complete len:98 (-) Transcript_60622:1044-1337(-)
MKQLVIQAICHSASWNRLCAMAIDKFSDICTNTHHGASGLNFEVIGSVERRNLMSLTLLGNLYNRYATNESPSTHHTKMPTRQTARMLVDAVSVVKM